MFKQSGSLKIRRYVLNYLASSIPKHKSTELRTLQKRSKLI